MEASEKRTFSGPVFRSSVIQMPGSYYLLGKKKVHKLFAIHHNSRLKQYGIHIPI